MPWRIYRTLRRAITIRDAIVALGALLLAYAPKILNAFKLVDWAEHNSVTMRPWLHVLSVCILSPYFPVVVMVFVVGMLLWLHWPVPYSARAEFFVEMLEQRIALAHAILKQTTNISLLEWKTWEQRTLLDMDNYLNDRSRYSALFGNAGILTTFEHEAGHEGIRLAFKRQVRALKAIIDATDQGKVQAEAAKLGASARSAT
jgi:hypothetical protein